MTSHKAKHGIFDRQCSFKSVSYVLCPFYKSSVSVHVTQEVVASSVYWTSSHKY